MEQQLALLSHRSSSRDEMDDLASTLSRSIAALAHLSKGFAKSPSEQVQGLFLEATQVVLRVVQTLPMVESIRDKSMVFLQRMIIVLGPKVLAPMPPMICLLIDHCTAEDLSAVAQLLNQLCIKFREDSVAVMDVALLRFLQKCQSLVPTMQVGGGMAPNDGTCLTPTASAEIPPHLVVE